MLSLYGFIKTLNIKISNIKKLFRFYCYKIFAWVSICLLFFNSVGCNTTEPTYTDGIDTTSHNFTFQTWSFGLHSSSILYDVAIINENDIWAVGEIYLNDSTGQPDPHSYNAIHWDGLNWKITRIPTKTFSGSIVSSIINTIFAYTINDIWTFSIAGSYSHWDGNQWATEFVDQRNGSANKILGTNDNNIYLMCNDGGISFYNSISWSLIPSGTDLNFYDIYENQDENNSHEIICIAAKQSVNSNKKNFRIENNSITELNVNGIPSSIRGIWFKPGEKYYVVGSGMFYKNNINSNESWISFGGSVTPYYTNSIDGNDVNDIVVCGTYGELLHFNGSDWKSYQKELEMQAGSYRTIKIKGNLLVAVGYDSPKAVITIGRR